MLTFWDDIEAIKRFVRDDYCRIEGIGIGRTPPLWEPTLVDDILLISTNDAEDMAKRLAREDDLPAGTSSAANVIALIRVAERLGRGAKVVTLMVNYGPEIPEH